MYYKPGLQGFRFYGGKLSLLKRTLFLGFVRGFNNAHRVRFWHDEWYAQFVLKNQFPNLYLVEQRRGFLSLIIFVVLVEIQFENFFFKET